MKKLMLIDNTDNNYVFADENNIIYRTTMWFENFASKPQPGDYMFISEQVLDDPEERITPKTYGPFTTLGFARKLERMTERDFIVVVNDEIISVYQRYYG